MIVLLHYGPKSDPSYVKINIDDGRVTIDGVTMSDQEWVELRHRVDAVLVRKDFGERKPRPVETPKGTKFILKNIKTLNDVQRGYVKPAPKFLRRWFDWVITKEEYGS